MKIVAGGIPLGDDFYKGRQACVDQLRKMIDQAGNILVLGPRRTGKTSSIQEYLRQNSGNEDFKFVFIDLENTQNLYEFYIRLIKDILQAANKYHALLDNVLDRIKQTASNIGKSTKLDIDLAPFLGSPTEVKLTVQWPDFDPKKVEALQTELRTLIASLKSPIIIVLDEFPELIWRFGQSLTGEDRRNEMIQKTNFLLSGLRMIRQEDFGLGKKHQIIVAGSINLHNTLKHLGLDASINDLERIEIPYLTSDQSADLIRQLVQPEEITFQNEKGFYSFIKQQFGSCSPFYIQAFANALRQKMLDKIGESNFSDEEIQNAYKTLLTEPRGPEYFVTRIERFYLKEKDLVFKILEKTASFQFNNKVGIGESDLKNALGISSQQHFTDIMAKMISDDMIQHQDGGSKIGFQSQFLCNFWNYRIVDGRYFI
ncbi:MAG: ATP-binding protein [Pseudobdellovibrionaceae bacterium]|jgi:AAA+ ATPase superfamily predicted ATPase